MIVIRKKITFWQRLDFFDGVMVIIMTAVCIATMAIFVSGFLVSQTPKAFLARVILGTVFSLSSGGYVYSLWKKTRREKNAGDMQ